MKSDISSAYFHPLLKFETFTSHNLLDLNDLKYIVTVGFAVYGIQMTLYCEWFLFNTKVNDS